MLALFIFFAGVARADEVTIFAAASTTEAVNRIIESYRDSGNGAVRGVFASSSILAKQIALGAPADLFLSASVEWMDYLEQRGAVRPDDRTDLLGNRLVLIAPQDSALEAGLTLDPGLAAALGNRRLAIGDPSHVPAGRYARSALQSLGLWGQLQGKLALTADVRAALALVDRGAVAAGLVYATDATISPRVRIVAKVPPDSHPGITYPLARTAKGQDGAVTNFLRFLNGPTARDIFQQLGFLICGHPEARCSS